jgi:hypothetical protein
MSQPTLDLCEHDPRGSAGPLRHSGTAGQEVEVDPERTVEFAFHQQTPTGGHELAPFAFSHTELGIPLCDLNSFTADMVLW